MVTLYQLGGTIQLALYQVNKYVCAKFQSSIQKCMIVVLICLTIREVKEAGIHLLEEAVQS